MFLRENEEGSRIAPHLRAGQSLLDLGAGTGFMARWLRDKTGVRPTAADTVEYANRDRSIPFVLQNDPFHVAVANGSFDVVLLMFVFHHITPYGDQVRLLDEAVRIARGRIIVTEDTPHSHMDRVMNTAWDWILNWRHGVPTPFTFRTAEEWTRVFGERGLRTAFRETYRPMWPTLKTYPHTLFVLDKNG